MLAGIHDSNFETISLHGHTSGSYQNGFSSNGQFGNGNSVRQTANGSLVFADIKKSDAGWYVCEAANGILPVLQQKLKLDVNGESSAI